MRALKNNGKMKEKYKQKMQKIATFFHLWLKGQEIEKKMHEYTIILLDWNTR